MQGEFGLLKNNVFIGVIFFRAKTGEEMKKSNTFTHNGYTTISFIGRKFHFIILIDIYVMSK